MSLVSLRARLDAATPGPWHATQVVDCWQIYDASDPFFLAGDLEQDDAVLIAHAPTDLRLALNVIEAMTCCAKGGSGCYTTDGAGDTDTCAVCVAYRAFEAAS